MSSDSAAAEENTEMKVAFLAVLIAVVVTLVSCTAASNQTVWLVEATEIPLYHSSTADPASGYIFHVEYCAAKLSSGSDVVHIVYRPIDFPNRNPGFAKGDTVTVAGLEKARDFSAMDGPDYWIHDIKVIRSSRSGTR